LDFSVFWRVLESEALGYVWAHEIHSSLPFVAAFQEFSG